MAGPVFEESIRVLHTYSNRAVIKRTRDSVRHRFLRQILHAAFPHSSHGLQSLSHSVRQHFLAQIPHVCQALFTEIDVLHVRDVLLWWLGHPRGDDDWIGLEDDAVVDDLVNGKRDDVVILYDRSLVC